MHFLFAGAIIAQSTPSRSLLMDPNRLVVGGTLWSRALVEVGNGCSKQNLNGPFAKKNPVVCSLPETGLGQVSSTEHGQRSSLGDPLPLHSAAVPAARTALLQRPAGPLEAGCA